MLNKHIVNIVKVIVFKNSYIKSCSFEVIILIIQLNILIRVLLKFVLTLKSIHQLTPPSKIHCK